MTFGSSSVDPLTCAFFAGILGKQEEKKIFGGLVSKSGMNMQIIVAELEDTTKLLNKLAMMQGVPVETLVAEMYPAMCHYIKA